MAHYIYNFEKEIESYGYLRPYLRVYDKKLLNKILSDLGYDRTKESKSRLREGQASADRRFDEVQGHELQGSRKNVRSQQKNRITKHIAKLLKKLGTKARTTIYHSFDELPADMS